MDGTGRGRTAVQVQASTGSPLSTGADTVAVGIFEGEEPGFDLPGGELAALLQSGEARRAYRRVALTHAAEQRFILVGLGPRSSFDAERARVVAALALRRARECGARILAWVLPPEVGEEIAEGLVTGTVLAAYAFRRYKPAPSDEPAAVQRLVVCAERDVSSAVQRAAVLAAAQNRARDLANTPANELTPAALADYAAALGERHEAISVTVLDGAEIRARGMGAFAAGRAGALIRTPG